MSADKPQRRKLTVKKDIQQDMPEIAVDQTTGQDSTEADWEARIAAAKTESVVEQEPAPVEQPSPEDIEEMIERRLQERLAAMEQPKQEPVKQPEQQPTEEDKTADIAHRNNASRFVNVVLGTEDDIIESINKVAEEDLRPVSEQQANPLPYIEGMAYATQYGQRSSRQHMFVQTLADQLLEKNPNALKEVDPKLRISRVIPKIGDGTGPKRLSGATARAAVISRMKGLYRVHLYNSGFWLDLRPPALIDIDGWMHEVDDEFKELGRVIGGHSYAVMDIYLKQKFFSILPTLVQRSNFEGFDDPDKLVSNISFHDYDTLLWAFCCMMYKEGIGAGVYCTNPDCTYIDGEQYVDLRNLCYINTDLFNERAMKWMLDGMAPGSAVKTEQDLKQYRQEILGFRKNVKTEDNMIAYTLEVPTMKAFIDDGVSLVSKLGKLVNGKQDINSDIVSNHLTYHSYKMLAPWILDLSMYDENGALVYRIEDREAIYESLDVETFNSSNLYSELVEFVKQTKLTIYSSTTLKCPRCGKKAALNKDNLLALDMQYLFFGLSCLTLSRTGASL